MLIMWIAKTFKIKSSKVKIEEFITHHLDECANYTWKVALYTGTNELLLDEEYPLNYGVSLLLKIFLLGKYYKKLIAITFL